VRLVSMLFILIVIIV